MACIAQSTPVESAVANGAVFARQQLGERIDDAIDQAGGASDGTERNPRPGSIGFTIAALEALTLADAFAPRDSLGARRVRDIARTAVRRSPRRATSEARENRRRVTLGAKPIARYSHKFRHRRTFAP